MKRTIRKKINGKKVKQKNGERRVNERTLYECSYVHARRVSEATILWCVLYAKARDLGKRIRYTRTRSKCRFSFLSFSLHYDYLLIVRYAELVFVLVHSTRMDRLDHLITAMIRCFVRSRRRVCQCETSKKKNGRRFSDATRKRQWPNRKCVQEIELGKKSLPQLAGNKRSFSWAL